jgi:hypothetical protein
MNQKEYGELLEKVQWLSQRIQAAGLQSGSALRQNTADLSIASTCKPSG